MNPTWPVEFVPLALLRQRSRHGYDLHRAITHDPVLHATWRVGRSELYFLLKKLEKRGWIVPVTSAVTQGPPRTPYTPTEPGLRALHDWLATPVPTPRDLRAEFLAKVYLGWLLGAAQTQDLLRHQAQILRSRLETSQRSTDATGFERHVHRLRQLQTQAALAWLEELSVSIARQPVERYVSDDTADLPNLARTVPG